MGLMFLGNLEGGSALSAGGVVRGNVRHSIRIYRDTMRDSIIATGKIWGDDDVLQHAVVGESVSLRLEDGATVEGVVQQRNTDQKFLRIGVDGGVPGF